MSNYYPHTMKVATITGVGKDANNNFLPGVPSTKDYQCRYSPNIGNGTVRASENAADGKRLIYDGIAYLPLTDDVIPFGAKVEIQLEGQLIRETVKRFHRGRFNVRVWL
jgi:hypothetical protein